LGELLARYELHLWGDDIPVDAGHLAEGFRFADDDSERVYLFSPGRWQVVAGYIDGPWSDTPIDFNNNGSYDEPIPELPARLVKIGVYGTDELLVGQDADHSSIDHYYIYGESEPTMPSENPTPVRLDVHFDQEPIRIDF
jgi:hypothetical protein